MNKQVLQNLLQAYVNAKKEAGIKDPDPAKYQYNEQKFKWEPQPQYKTELDNKRRLKNIATYSDRNKSAGLLTSVLQFGGITEAQINSNADLNSIYNRIPNNLKIVRDTGQVISTEGNSVNLNTKLLFNDRQYKELSADEKSLWRLPIIQLIKKYIQFQKAARAVRQYIKKKSSIALRKEYNERPAVLAQKSISQVKSIYNQMQKNYGAQFDDQMNIDQILLNARNAKITEQINKFTAQLNIAQKTVTNYNAIYKQLQTAKKDLAQKQKQARLNQLGAIVIRQGLQQIPARVQQEVIQEEMQEPEFFRQQGLVGGLDLQQPQPRRSARQELIRQGGGQRARFNPLDII